MRPVTVDNVPGDDKKKGPVLWQTGIESARRLASAAATDVRETVSQARRLSLEPPPPDRHLRRVGHAFALPFVLLGMTLRDPRHRGPYLRTAIPTALVTLVVGIFAVVSPWTRDYFRKDTPRRHHRAVVAPLVGGRDKRADVPEPPPVPEVKGVLPESGPDNDADDEEDDSSEAKTDSPDDASESQRPKKADARLPAAEPTQREETLAVIAAELRKAKAKSEQDRLKKGKAGDEGDQKAEEVLERVAAKLDKAREKGRNPSRDAATDAAVVKALESIPADLADEEDRDEPPKRWSWPSLGELYAALILVEWWTLALSRDYQNQLSRRICLLSGASPEDPEQKPRLRFRPRWFWKKMRRKLRGAILLASGAIPLVLLSLIPVLKLAYSMLLAAWGFYWLSVFCLGAAALGWSIDAPGDPWFIRVTDRLGKVPLIGWVARVYNRLWRKVSRSVRPVCATYERAPYEGTGLALARMLCGLPMIYGFVRPVFAVAAQHAVRGHVDPPAAERPPLANAVLIENQVGSDPFGEIG